ncbi:MAG: hypothetical protein LBS36_04340 [Oscillospiraceae bacterium]|nr:hypothetical protein [Oscillospiraceae bacterium]
MADDKFQDIINKLQNGEQPQIQNPVVNAKSEGLKSINEGLKRSNYTLNKNEGHTVEISTKDED